MQERPTQTQEEQRAPCKARLALLVTMLLSSIGGVAAMGVSEHRFNQDYRRIETEKSLIYADDSLSREEQSRLISNVDNIDDANMYAFVGGMITIGLSVITTGVIAIKRPDSTESDSLVSIQP